MNALEASKFIEASFISFIEQPSLCLLFLFMIFMRKMPDIQAFAYKLF